MIVQLRELAAKDRVLELASIVSNTRAAGIYLILLSEVKPRDELREVEELKGAMLLIRLLEDAALPVLVSCSSSDVVLWKAAGATSCASGKFHNLRRFTSGRFNEKEDGGRQIPYWFEESLLAFVRGTDIPRLQTIGLADPGTNPFAKEILAQDPSKAWLGLGWRQYLHWFASIETRITAGAVNVRDLIIAAEANWEKLEKNQIYLEERSNKGEWLRPWLRAVVEFNK